MTPSALRARMAESIFTSVITRSTSRNARGKCARARTRTRMTGREMMGDIECSFEGGGTTNDGGLKHRR